MKSFWAAAVISSLMALGAAAYGNAAHLDSPSAAASSAADLQDIIIYNSKLASDNPRNNAIQNAMKFVKSRNISCEITSAIHRISISDTTEISCKNSIGYIIKSFDSKFDDADCVTAQDNPINCVLPANKHPELGLVPYIQEVDLNCAPEKARFIAGINNIRIGRYEIKCKSGRGYVLDIPYSYIEGGNTKSSLTHSLKVEAYNCLQIPGVCKWTPHTQAVSQLSAMLISQIATICQLVDANYMGYSPSNNSDVYEIKCQGKPDIFIVTINIDNRQSNIVKCTYINIIGAECKFPNRP